MRSWITKFTLLLGLAFMVTSSPLQAQNEAGKPTETGSIEIISVPDKAMVHIDGEKQGLTPYKAKELAVGEHTLKIHKQGFEDHEQTFTIVAGSNKSIGIALDKLTKVSIKSKPKGATVYLDGDLVGTTPFKAKLPTGKHALQLKLLGYADVDQEVIIIEGYSNKFTFSQLFQISFVSEPTAAEVFMDGKYLGDAPFTGDYSAGKHTIKMQLDDHETFEKQLKLKKNIVLEAKLKKPKQGSGLFKKTVFVAALIGGGYYYYITYVDLPVDAGFPAPPSRP